jgi:hypothetical protein
MDTAVDSVEYSLYVSSDVLDHPKVQPFFILNTLDSSSSISVPELPVFIIDSGASRPMSYQRECFSNLVEDVQPVKLGNGNVIYTQGRGSIGNLRDVYYVPDLQFNLLSVSYLNELGLHVIFDKSGDVLVTDNLQSSMKYRIGTKQSGIFKTSEYLYHIKPSPNKISGFTKFEFGCSSIVNPERVNYEKLIHQRFAHINDAYVNYAIKNNLVTVGKSLQNHQQFSNLRHVNHVY